LDEATSALDVHSESIVQKTLEQVSKSRTTIVIAHRLSTIKRADKIVVMRDGAVVEEGTHSELLDKDGGTYSQLVNAQAIVLGIEDHELKDVQIEELERIATEKHEQDDADQDAADRIKDPAKAKDSEKKQTYVRALGRIMLDQFKRHPVHYVALFAAAAASGGKLVYELSNA
jgi:ATP-binding cassette, subfamily B (MDR/TAP), member 1